MAVAFTFSPPLPFRAVESRANPLSLNILHVSTFASKILRAVQQPRPNELKDLACPTSGATARMAQFQQLSPILSRFYVQLLWIQRFFPCLSAKLMITKDHRERGYIPRERVEPKIAALTLLPSIFYQQLLWIQRFCSCSPPNPMILQDHRERDISRIRKNRDDIWAGGAQSLTPQFLGHQFIHQLRIRLALGGLHHLTDKKNGDGLLARAVLFHLLWIRGDDFVDCFFQRGGVA